jgi:hypothetical protein
MTGFIRRGGNLQSTDDLFKYVNKCLLSSHWVTLITVTVQSTLTSLCCGPLQETSGTLYSVRLLDRTALVYSYRLMP